MELQRHTQGIDWPGLVELFRLAELSGREGDKVRRAFENSDGDVLARQDRARLYDP